MGTENPDISMSLEARLARFGLAFKNPNSVAQNAAPSVEGAVAKSPLDPKKTPPSALTAGGKEKESPGSNLDNSEPNIKKLNLLADLRTQHQLLFPGKPDPNMSIEGTQDTGYSVVIGRQSTSLQLTPDTTLAQKEEMVRALLVQQLIARLGDVVGNPSIYDGEFTDRLNTGYDDLMAAKKYLTTLGGEHSQLLIGRIDTQTARMIKVYRDTITNLGAKSQDLGYDVNMATARARELLLGIQIENIKTGEFYTVRGPKMGEQPFASIVDARALIATDMAKNKA